MLTAYWPKEVFKQDTIKTNMKKGGENMLFNRFTWIGAVVVLAVLALFFLFTHPVGGSIYIEDNANGDEQLYEKIIK